MGVTAVKNYDVGELMMSFISSYPSHSFPAWLSFRSWPRPHPPTFSLSLLCWVPCLPFFLLASIRTWHPLCLWVPTRRPPSLAALAPRHRVLFEPLVSVFHFGEYWPYALPYSFSICYQSRVTVHAVSLVLPY